MVRAVLLSLVIGELGQAAIPVPIHRDEQSQNAPLAAGTDATADGIWAGATSAAPSQMPAAPQDEGLCPWFGAAPRPWWTVGYRARWLFNSRTRYEFGTIPDTPPIYAPLSRLDWSLNSQWQGFQIGSKGRDWELQFEWLAPVGSKIQGNLDDYDWLTPGDPTHLDSLSSSALRWNEGQLLDLGAEFHLTDCDPLGVWVEIWPMAGFRFQRFAMTGHDGLQIIGDGVVVPPSGTPLPGDLITFNQQYYMGYIGGQLRSTLRLGRLPPIACTFQGDWGRTAGYNIDHHLFYESLGVHRYTMESTYGGAVHFSFAAQMPITPWLSVGVQFDHMDIHTTGSHRWLTYDDYGNRLDLTWDNGVKVTSTQNSVTAFLQARF